MFPSSAQTAVRAPSYIDITVDTNHSSTPDFLRAHLITSRGTLSNAFSRSTKAKHFLFLTIMLLPHLSDQKDSICCSISRNYSKLQVIHLYHVADPCLYHPLHYLHSLI